jgi:hypothetical protein
MAVTPKQFSVTSIYTAPISIGAFDAEGQSINVKLSPRGSISLADTEANRLVVAQFVKRNMVYTEAISTKSKGSAPVAESGTTN